MCGTLDMECFKIQLDKNDTIVICTYLYNKKFIVIVLIQDFPFFF
jgi:hypothetical protein